MEIVIPKNNEDKFLDIAQALGIKKITFLYDFDSENKIEKLPNLKNKNITITHGLIVNSKNLRQASNFSNFSVAKSSEQDRRMIELGINMLFGFEDNKKKDYLHHRASGLNHVLCSEASKKNVIIGFPYSSIFKIDDAHVLLGRMMQNLRLCRKFNVRTIIASFASDPHDMRSAHDVSSLFKLIGQF